MWRKQNATVCTGTATAETICSTRRQTGFTARIAESGNMVSNASLTGSGAKVRKYLAMTANADVRGCPPHDANKEG